MTDNPHFETVASWTDARDHLGFEPRVPAHTAGRDLESLAIFVRDHKHRDVPPEGRSLEAHYGSFVVSQSRPGVDEARRQVVEVPYGRAPRATQVGGCDARVYELGPEVPPDDIDGRSPAVVVWHDDDRFFLVASDQLPADALVPIATSM